MVSVQVYIDIVIMLSLVANCLQFIFSRQSIFTSFLQKEEAMARERHIQEHAKQVHHLKQAESEANKPASSQTSAQQLQSDAARDEDERRLRSESLRKQRAAVRSI